jgi:integrase/recombinase XerD
MITIKQVFDYRTPKSNGEIPVRLRVTHNRKTTHISLNASLTEVQIKKIEQGEVDQELTQFRKELDDLTHNAREVAAKLHPFSVDELKRQLSNSNATKQNKDLLLVDIIKLKLKQLEDHQQYKSKGHYKTLLKLMTIFDSTRLLKNVDQDFLHSFEQFYIDGRIKKDGEDRLENYYNTLGIYLRNLKAVINLGRDHKMVDHTYEFPFGKNKYIIKTYNTEKEIFSVDQVNSLMTFNSFDTKYQENAHDHWKVCFLCNGSNMSDVLQFKWTDIDDDIISFVRQKTENRTKNVRKLSIPIIRPLKELIDKIGNRQSEYIFGGFRTPPKRTTIQNKVSKMCKGYNKHLKVIGVKIGLPIPLTISTSRHSYGNYLAKSGVPLERIAEMMGHKDKQRFTTYHYIGSLDKKILFETNGCLKEF